jgi:hypothetical protein
MGEDLQDALIESVADRSDHREMRKIFTKNYIRKQYNFKHKRYKLMLRWAHHAIKCRNIDTLGSQATYRCGKM